jgi:hypothetical protein
MNVAAWPSLNESGIATSCLGDTTTSLANPPRPRFANTRSPIDTDDRRMIVGQLDDAPDDLTARHERHRRLDLVAPSTNNPSTKFTPDSRHGETHLPRAQGALDSRSTTRRSSIGPNAAHSIAVTIADIMVSAPHPLAPGVGLEPEFHHSFLRPDRWLELAARLQSLHLLAVLGPHVAGVQVEPPRHLTLLG